MLGLSISDAIASVVNILSTWPIPAGTQWVYLASGTTGTCTAQGFFNELGNLATPLYNASLCAYYALVIRDGWSEDQIRKKAEPFMHTIPTVVAALIALLGLPFKLYNNSGWLCWFAEYPSNCKENGNCVRGEHSEIFRWVHYVIIWSAIAFVSVQMYSIYRKVREQEGFVAQQFDAETTRRGTKAKKVAVQAALFVGALYMTWFFTTVTRIYQNVTGHNEFALLVLMAIFFPLQGFFNALIYIRPRYLRCRSRNPGKSWRYLFYIALHRDGHPIHGTPTRGSSLPMENRRDMRADGRRRSSTASFYSTGNSKRRLSAGSNYSSDGEASCSVADTVNARADESEFRKNNKSKGEDALDAVTEDCDEDAPQVNESDDSADDDGTADDVEMTVAQEDRED